MPRSTTLGLLGLSLLASCAGAQTPPPWPAFRYVSYVPRPAAPLPPPPLVIVPRAEASPRRAPEPPETEIKSLRSEGKRHALKRTADGIAVLSEERGVLGFLKSPLPGAEIRWAGFVNNDAIITVTGESIHRAATPDDAIAGKLEALGKIDPAATMIASGGDVVVAAVPGAGGAFYTSRDGGKHLKPSKRPDNGALAGLVARSDGAVVAAIEKETFSNEWGAKGLRAQVFVQLRVGPWTKGPVAEAFSGAPLDQHGDSITLELPEKPGDASRSRTRGLDASGKWIEARNSDSDWLRTWGGNEFSPVLPVARPGFTVPRKEEENGFGGIVGGLNLENCGVDCLSYRDPVGSPPFAEIIQFGECGRENATSTKTECDKAQPARRPTTLLVRDGDKTRLVRLPLTCASGWLEGTERASFVYCSSAHQGRPGLLHVAPSGVLTEVGPGMPGDLSRGISHRGAESASDGTTVLFTEKGVCLCVVAGAPACKFVPREGFLGARPVPGGRALIASRGASQQELVLELLGEVGATPIRVMVQGNLLELEITAEGYVRLWTSPTLTYFHELQSPSSGDEATPVDAFLVRTDGQLIADVTAKQALLSAPR